MRKFDLIINGGGMVGAAVAVGAAKLGFKVAIIEANPAKDFDPNSPMDLRVSAISVASEQLLTQLGAWPSINSMRTCPYLGLETWERNENVKTAFRAEEVGASHLGHIIENRVIVLALWQQFADHSITPFTHTSINQINRNKGVVEITLASGEQLTAPLLVAADGANSYVRHWAGIGISGWDYGHHCMLININTEQGQQDTTWQQFTPTGPKALLPLPGNKASLVWYDSPATIKQLQQLNPRQLQSQIAQIFPNKLGQFEVVDYASFPLTRRHAQRYFIDNVVLLGDAAHTINPLAGQGVNLGFKDVAVLLQELEKVAAEQLGDTAWLQRYQDRRYKDNLLMMSAMDVFYKGFKIQTGPLPMLRNMLLKLANHSGPIKKQVLKYAMGLG
ncbi:FAD-dependent monooxygenase [Paraferrimonas sp. SM1919]|uniref:FAD-dependent monooxygenase n=1 Tax=Paraferrimonas sp. SM1919 TaxID=2662263 RepID=UPI0013D0943B|nr:FAD-dependent monooxygenase [Paraferrimonas sp. SM1919]